MVALTDRKTNKFMIVASWASRCGSMLSPFLFFFFSFLMDESHAYICRNLWYFNHFLAVQTASPLSAPPPRILKKTADTPVVAPQDRITPIQSPSSRFPAEGFLIICVLVSFLSLHTEKKS